MPIHKLLTPHRSAIKTVLLAIEDFSRDGKIRSADKHSIKGVKALCLELARVELGQAPEPDEHLLEQQAMSLRRQWYRWRDETGSVPSVRRLAIILSIARARNWYPPMLSKSAEVEQLHLALDSEAAIQRNRFTEVAKVLRSLSRDFDELEENDDPGQMLVLERLAQCTPWAISALEGSLHRLRPSRTPWQGAYAHADLRAYTKAAMSSWKAVAERLGMPNESLRVRLFSHSQSASDNASLWTGGPDEPPSFDEDDEGLCSKESVLTDRPEQPKRKRGRPQKPKL